MKLFTLRWILCFMVMSTSFNVFSQTITLNELKAFPTAEGAGAVSTGGRGGEVYWVTNTNSSGAGSFIDAVANTSGPRTIMFAVGGTIPFTSHMYANSPNITIAGQSAHDLGGVYFDTDGDMNHFMYFDTPNSIYRYIGTRGYRALDGYDGDPILLAFGSNIIFDHISDIGGVQGNSPNDGINITIQYCLFTESEYEEHDVGTQFWNGGYPASEPDGYIDYIYNANLLKSHRFPAVFGYPNTKMRVVNNYCYRWGTRHMNAYMGVYLDAIYNHFQEDIIWTNGGGHSKSQTFAIEPENGYMASVHLYDNWHFSNDGTPLFSIDNSANMFHSVIGLDVSDAYRSTPMISLDQLPYPLINDPGEVKSYVLDNAGAGVRYSANGTTTVIDIESRYKGYAINQNENATSFTDRVSYNSLPLQTKSLTSFEAAHGFPETWATAHGLGLSANVNNEVTTNWSGINGIYNVVNNAGYSNLEIYLAELAGDFHMLANTDSGAPQYTLTTSVGTGSGSISPAGGSFNENSTITVQAFPAAGYVFSGWNGALSGTTNPTTIVMNSNKNITANFEPSPGGGGSTVIGHWPLDETSGSTLMDVSGGNHHAMMNNTASDIYVSGQIGGGIYFNGNRHASISNANALRPSSVTIAAFVKPSTASNWDWIAAHGDNYGLYVNNSGKIYFYYYGGSNWYGVMGTTVVADNSWHHVAGTFDNTTKTIKVYVNGVLENQETFTNPISYTQGTDFYIGAMSGERHFKGTLDDIYLFGNVLSQQEIQGLMTSSTVAVNIKTILQGPYDSATGWMNDHIRTQGHIPLSEPYGALGYDVAHESTTPSILNQTGSNAIVDWILVELRSASNPATIVSSRVGLLQRDGDIVSADGSSFSMSPSESSVYVVVRHRNHLGMRTSNLYNTSSTIQVDFTNTNTAIVGSSGQIIVSGKRIMKGGDANNDGQVNSFDLNNRWRVQNSVAYDYYGGADFNLDGTVNAFDLILFWRINNFSTENLD